MCLLVYNIGTQSKKLRFHEVVTVVTVVTLFKIRFEILGK